MWFKRKPQVSEEVKVQVVALTLAANPSEIEGLGGPYMSLSGQLLIAMKAPKEGILSKADLDFIIENMKELTGPYQPEWKAKRAKHLLMVAEGVRERLN